MNPLSAMYGGAVKVRNHLYDRGILSSHRLAAPVISVGSISAGGAGKTPFVIMLGEMLQARGVRFDVLSRGYGRKSRGARVVDPNGTAAEFGDEPLLIARRLGCPVVVGESRYQAGMLAESQSKPDLHILDDGFQHRSLVRYFDIALLSSDDLQDQLLPFGRLREPLASLRRADAIVLSGDVELDDRGFAEQQIWRVQRSLTLPEIPPRPVVFCGVARPHKFLQQLKAAGVSPAAFKPFRDHHAYSQQDVASLLALCDESAGGGFITTEKDAVNFGPLASQFGRVSVARVNMEITGPADALDTMLRVIDGQARKA